MGHALMDLTGRTRGADFRLHAMDLQDAVAIEHAQRHWMLDEPALRSCIAALMVDFRNLRAWGCGPFAVRRVTSYGVIEHLGFAHHGAPSGLLDQVSQTLRMLIAAARTSLTVQRELARLTRAGRY
jgi:hypothetical protein